MPAIRKIATIGGIKARTRRLAPIGVHPPVQAPTDLPEEIQALIPRIGERNARTVWRMQRKGIQGSVPELLAYAWLEARRIPFDFQSAVFAARRLRGGLVLDFVLYNLAEGCMVWRIQGGYWHGSAAARRRDAADKVRLRGARVNGATIRYVIDIYERDILRSPNSVFRDALRGRERQ